MKALIIAGGLGTRLKSVIRDMPKPMATIQGKPFLEYQLMSLKEYGINNIVLCVGYKWEAIKDYFGDGHGLGLFIEYSVEEEPMGTAGALKLAEKFVDSTFLCLNGDTFLEINYNQLIEYHYQKEAFVTLALSIVEHSSRYGKIVLNADNRITGYYEKNPSVDSKLISAGVYVINPGLLSYIKANQKLSLEDDIFPQIISLERAFGFVTKTYFKDIGTPESYQEFQEYIAKVKWA